jgi:ATP-dependent RNA helicase DeaD
MTTEFTVLNLHPELVQAVVERGYVTPTPIQSAVIPVMIAGQDVIGQAQTGTGKTAAFALPILQNLRAERTHVQALVVVPTRELAMQVADAMSEYGRHTNARVLVVYGGASYGPQMGALRRGVDIVVGTPGRLLDLIHKGVLKIQNVHTVVLDEADEMLSMGFIEDMEAILSETPAERQTTLFSATMPPEIRRLADHYMRDPQYIAIQAEQVTVDTIDQTYYLVNGADKTAALTRLFEIEEITSALIFTRTRAGSSDLANELSARGFPAEALNGDLSQEARERTLNRFRQNKITVLVATDVAARGLDIDDISHVFNFDLPDDPELYVHRIGRTGRAGKSGKAITLVTPFEKHALRQIEAFARHKLNRATIPTEDEIRAQREGRLVTQVTTWLRRGRCLQERAVVDKLVAEGHDPAAVAAAALKIARADEKQRPIYPVSEVLEPKPRERYDSRERSNGRGMRRDYRGGDSRRDGREPVTQSNISHEPGMVRLSLDKGRQHGIRPNDIVGAIAAHAEIPGRVIGKIHIQDRMSYVDIPEEIVGQVLSKNGELSIRRLPVSLQKA